MCRPWRDSGRIFDPLTPQPWRKSPAIFSVQTKTPPNRRLDGAPSMSVGRATPPDFPLGSLQSRAAMRSFLEKSAREVLCDKYPPGWSPKTAAQGLALHSLIAEAVGNSGNRSRVQRGRRGV